MPIYEFKCESCGSVTEKLQKMSDPYPTECPHCKSGRLTKLISPSGFVLKGNGWYATDFKSKSSSSTSSEASQVPAAASTSTPSTTPSDASASSSSSTGSSNSDSGPSRTD